MATMIVVSQISRRTLVNKSKASLRQRIYDLYGALGREAPFFSHFEGRDRRSLVDEIMGLHAQLPNDTQHHPDVVVVGEVVPREDGRFYIPLFRVPAVPGLSDTVLRVASDAFLDLESAKGFAIAIAAAYNAGARP